MDGAAKFVRGDAIAGLLIVFINVVAGIIIGVAQHNLSLAQALQTYTVLTVGDGLVTQIPALIVSTAAGLLVSKAGVTGSADKVAVHTARRLSQGAGPVLRPDDGARVDPRHPGPAVPRAVRRHRRPRLYDLAASHRRGGCRDRRVRHAGGRRPKSRSPRALHIDTLRLELGYALLPLINSEKGLRLTDQIKALRRQIATDMGFVMPAVRIQDNMQLSANSYLIRVKEIASGRGDIRANMLLVMDPKGDQIALPGEATKEPTFGLPAMWVEEGHREEALFKGLTVVDPSTVITTHLTEVIKDNMAEMLSYSETQKLLDDLGTSHQKLVSDIVPSQISVGGIQRVLQNLLGERVSIRDLPTILEGISEACGTTRNVTAITEHVRSRLARQLCEAVNSPAGFIPLVTLAPEWEQAFAEIRGRPGRRPPAFHGAVATAGIHRQGAPGVRAPRHDGRDARAADEPAGAALCALDRRALPADDHGDVAKRDLPQGPHQDRGTDLRIATYHATQSLHRPDPQRSDAPGARRAGPGGGHHRHAG